MWAKAEWQENERMVKKSSRCKYTKGTGRCTCDEDHLIMETSHIVVDLNKAPGDQVEFVPLERPLEGCPDKCRLMDTSACQECVEMSMFQPL